LCARGAFSLLEIGRLNAPPHTPLEFTPFINHKEQYMTLLGIPPKVSEFIHFL
jgi:hypothetical protein